MIRSYLKIALRHLAGHKLFSIINILCLSVGITFSMIIGLYVLKQEQVNHTLKNVDRQYIVRSNWKVKEMGLDFTTLGPLAKTAQQEYPALVENYFRFNPVTTVITAGDQHFKEDIAIGDTTFVNMYGFPVLYGSREKAFANINSAVVTETMARKLFGTAHAVGRTFSMMTTRNGVSQQYTVSVVLQDLPSNSVTGVIGNDYQIFVPTIGNNYYGGGDPAEGWNGGAYEVARLELRPGVTPQMLVGPFKQILSKYGDKNTRENLEVQLAPVRTYYLTENDGAVRKMITALSLVAVFILLMAMINFVNINIGTSTYRLKEIGLRKVFGGQRLQLALQFMSEALLLTFAAAGVSLVMYEILRGLFSGVLNTPLPGIEQFSPAVAACFTVFVLAVGLVSGLYPALVLSGSNTARAVGGYLDGVKNGLGFRRMLVTLQFALALVVFIGALNVSRQMSYIFDKDLGYNRQQLLIVDAIPKQWDKAGVERMENVQQQIEGLPQVKSASLSFEIPTRKPPGQITLLAPGKKGNPLVLASFVADKYYARTFGLKLAAGSFFQPGGAHIPNEIVINESAARALGFGTAGEAVGRVIEQPAGNPPLTIAGVVDDYHYSSLQEEIEPVVIVSMEDALSYRYMNIRLATADYPGALRTLEKKWKELLPGAPFSYTFMDDQFNALYRSERQLKTATAIATALNLVIVFMGIFGLVAFTLILRHREMAIRKVLGANTRAVLLLFLKGYVGQILVAAVIACPVAYFLVDRWLENYAYRIQQSGVPYLLACGVLLVSTCLLIMVQCLRSARANPARDLRTA